MSARNLHKILNDPREAAAILEPTSELDETSFQPNNPEKLFERHIWIPLLLMALISLIPVVYLIKWIINKILSCFSCRRRVTASEVTGRDDGQNPRRMRMIKGCVRSETVYRSINDDNWENLEKQLTEFAESFQKIKKMKLERSTQTDFDRKEESLTDSTEEIVATNEEINGLNRLMALEKFPRYQ